MAIMCNQVKVVQMLVEAGADLQAQYGDPCYNMVGRIEPPATCIRLAIRFGRREIVKILWDAGAQQGDRQGEQEQLLHVAARHDQPDILAELLAWYDDWTQADKDKALLRASIVWCAKSVAILLKTSDHAALDKSGLLQSCLLNCVRTRGSRDGLVFEEYGAEPDWALEESAKQAATVKVLLQAYPNADFATMMQEAAWRPNAIETLRLLLTMGIDPNLRSPVCNRENATPLHRAVEMMYWRGSNSAAVTELLACGADPNITDRAGKAVLHWAARSCDDPSLVRMLLENEADPVAVDREGLTPGIEAAYSRVYEHLGREELQVKVVKVLVEPAPQRLIDWEDDEGKNVRKWAKDRQLPEDWREW